MNCLPSSSYLNEGTSSAVPEQKRARVSDGSEVTLIALLDVFTRMQPRRTIIGLLKQRQNRWWPTPQINGSNHRNLAWKNQGEVMIRRHEVYVKLKRPLVS